MSGKPTRKGFFVDCCEEDLNANDVNGYCVNQADLSVRSERERRHRTKGKVGWCEGFCLFKKCTREKDEVDDAGDRMTGRTSDRRFKGQVSFLTRLRSDKCLKR